MDFARRGKIVWTTLGPRGNYKKRPAVIVSDVSRPPPGTKIHIVAGTTKFDEPLSPLEVKLPSEDRQGGHHSTRLRSPTVIVCDWTEVIDVADIEGYAGVVPASILAEILRKIPKAPEDSR